ncbi:MAG: hypothetical protein ACE5GO_01670 [Anaerolineales bacterium]
MAHHPFDGFQLFAGQVGEIFPAQHFAGAVRSGDPDERRLVVFVLGVGG